MVKAAKRYVVTWNITQPGDEQNGILCIRRTHRGACIAALRSINDNWVQGEWSTYAPQKVAELRRLIAVGAYEEALQQWDTMNSYYEIGIHETEDPHKENEEVSLDVSEMQFEED